MNDFDISIIIPTYNRQKFVVKCIESVLNIDNVNIECIVVDDYSSDETRIILESIYSNYKNIKLIFNQSNIGVQNSRNIGLEYAHSNLVMFLDSDDYLEFNSLKSKIDYINKSAIVSLFSSYRVIYENDTYGFFKNVFVNHIEPPNNFKDSLRNFKILPTGSIIFDKQKFNTFKFDTSLKSGHDDDLILQLMKFGGFSFHNSILYNFYQHSHEHISSNKNLAIGDLQLAFKYYSDCVQYHGRNFANLKILKATVNLFTFGIFSNQAFFLLYKEFNFFLFYNFLILLLKIPAILIKRFITKLKILIIHILLNINNSI